jgi:hypothetical protein
MTTTRNYDEARQYSELIAQEVKALEQLLTLDPYDDDNANEIAAALYELEIHPDTIGEPADALNTYLNEIVLEVTYYTTTGDHDDETTTRTVLLRTCGGPRCEITRDSYDGHQIGVTTYVLDENYTHRVTAPNLADVLNEMARNHHHTTSRRS